MARKKNIKQKNSKSAALGFEEKLCAVYNETLFVVRDT